jgi:predicted  nucleic acid-binding Zn-ribbon protein
MKVTIKSLEQRLASAQTKIEELNSVKGENEQLTKKHGVLKKQLEASVLEIEGYKKRQEDMLKKYEELEKKAAAG